MKKSLWFLLAAALHLAACQSSDPAKAPDPAKVAVESTASNPLVAATETRLATAVQQPLVAGAPTDPASTAAQGLILKTWYASELPDAVKLSPSVEKLFKLHQLVLGERAGALAKFGKHPELTAADKQQLTAQYDAHVAASLANLNQLSTLATTKGGGLAPADLEAQLTGLVEKETGEARGTGAVSRDAQRLSEQASEQLSRQRLKNTLGTH